MTPQELNLTAVAYSVNDLLALLPLGRTSIYSAIKSGELKATKFGKKTLFFAPDVAAFLTKIRQGSHTDWEYKPNTKAKG